MLAIELKDLKVYLSNSNLPLEKSPIQFNPLA